METVKVKIKPELAKKGLGFFDFEQNADIFPNENGKSKPDKVFNLKKTRFIQAKIDSGELVQVGKPSAATSENKNQIQQVEIGVIINGTELKKVTIDEKILTAENQGKVIAALFKDAEVKEAATSAGKKMKEFTVDTENMTVAMVRE